LSRFSNFVTQLVDVSGTEILQAGLRDSAADDIVEFGHSKPLQKIP
jgi:hypothetical protein